MASSDFCHSSEDSSASDDPDQSSAVPNSQLQIDDAYATDPDSAVDGTPQKKFDEENGQSHESVSHARSGIQAQAPSFSQPT
jgi:hypothetical protein